MQKVQCEYTSNLKCYVGPLVITYLANWIKVKKLLKPIFWDVWEGHELVKHNGNLLTYFMYLFSSSSP